MFVLFRTHSSNVLNALNARYALICVAMLAMLFCSSAAQAQRSISVDEAVAEALKNNWDVRLARSDAELARTADSWGATAAYPIAGIVASTSSAGITLNQQYANGTELSKSGITQSQTNASLSATWKIFDGMRMFATKSRLEELRAQGEIQMLNRISQTVYDVSLAYFNLVRLRQQLKATNELVVVLEERFKIAKLRYEIGSSARNDALQAEIDLNDQKASLLSQKKTIEQAEITLSQLMGLAQPEQFSVQDSIELSSTISASELQTAVQNANYSVLNAQRDLSVALQVRREIASQGLPSVSLLGAYNFARVDNSAVLSTSAPLLNQNAGLLFGVGVTIPLFNGMNTQTQMDVQDIAIHKAEIAIDALRSKVNSSYRNALADYQSAGEIYSLQKSNVDLAQQNASIAMERFRRQSITTVELRQIQLTVLQEQTSMLNTRYNAKAAELQLMLLAARLAKQ